MVETLYQPEIYIFNPLFTFVYKYLLIILANISNPTETIRCPKGLKAFAGYPSKDCPSEAYFYKCVKGIAVVSKCNSTSRYILFNIFIHINS